MPLSELALMLVTLRSLTEALTIGLSLYISFCLAAKAERRQDRIIWRLKLRVYRRMRFSDLDLTTKQQLRDHVVQTFAPLHSCVATCTRPISRLQSRNIQASITLDSYSSFSSPQLISARFSRRVLLAASQQHEARNYFFL